MEAIVDILKKKVPHQAHMGLHADAIAEMAAIADTLFPAGSEGGDALPAIWEQPEEFAKRLQAFKEAAAGFRQTVSEGGEVGAAVQNLGGACKVATTTLWMGTKRALKGRLQPVDERRPRRLPNVALGRRQPILDAPINGDHR